MKKLITNYTFNAADKTVALPDYPTLNQSGLLLITNVTDGILIYNFADPTLGATVAGNTIVLEYDTTGMDAADKLQIFYDDGSDIQNVEIVNVLRGILLALVNPPHMDKSQNRVRETAVVESGTITTVTNLTNFGTQPADALYRLTSQNTWANMARRTIS